MDFSKGETQMMNVAEGAWGDIEAAARELLAAGKEIAPLMSPGGSRMFHVTTDASRLRIALLEAVVDGTKVFIGIPADK